MMLAFLVGFHDDSSSVIIIYLIHQGDQHESRIQVSKKYMQNWLT